MNAADVEAIFEGSMEALQTATSAHQSAWHFGEEERWDFSQERGELIFTFPTIVATAPAQIIGTLDSRAGTWMWAWANSAVVDSLKADSLRVREYGAHHGIERLTSPKWLAEEMDAWKMTALACRLCGSNGAYRGPAGDTYVFMTFGEVELKRKHEPTAGQTP